MIHAQLEKDSIFINNLQLSQIRLHKNAVFPWLILIPQKPDLVEWIDLSIEDQILLVHEINLASQVLFKLFNPDKINIGSLGNIVQQLHIHIVGRFRSDPAFPGPVWGCADFKNYEEGCLNEIISKVQSFISK